MMMSTRILVAGLAAAMLTAGCVQSADDALPKPSAAARKSTKPPVAIVNGRPISAEVFELFVSTQMHGTKSADLPPEVRKQALDELIRLYVARAQAEKEGIDAKPDVAARLDVTATTLLADQVNSAYMQGKQPTDVELKAEYDAVVARMPKLEYRARHVLVATEKEAQDIIASLNKGGSIANIASKVSQDTGSKQQGGDLGWFAAENMVKPFAAALVDLKKGEHTKQPVKSDFGWHVIKLEDTRAFAAPPLEQVKPQVQRMVQQKQLDAYLDSLAKDMKIERKL